jgi:hypothetical protein
MWYQIDALVKKLLTSAFVDIDKAMKLKVIVLDSFEFYQLRRLFAVELQLYMTLYFYVIKS